MPTANITNPNSLSPNITNDSSYTVQWTVSGAIGFGATWKLQIQAPGSVSFQDISTSLPGPTTSFVWTKQASASIIVAKGLDELATGTYNLRLLYTHRGRNFILDTQSFNMFRGFTATVTDEIEADDSPGFNRGYEIAWSVILGGILDVNDNIAYKKGIQRSRLETIDVNDAQAKSLGLQRSRLETIDVNDVQAKSLGLQRTRLETLDVNDNLAWNFLESHERTATCVDSLTILDYVDYDKLHGYVGFVSARFVIEDYFKYVINRSRKTKAVSINYILTRDHLKHKIKHTTHEKTILDSPISIKDRLVAQLSASTKRSMSNYIIIDDSVEIMYIPYQQEVVYHIDHDAFTKFTQLDIKASESINYGESEENTNLLVTNSNKILKFPGDNVTNKDAIIETKTLYLEKGVAQNMKIMYEGEAKVNIEAYQLEQSDSDKKTFPITSIEKNKWLGINPKIGRIRALAFKFFNLKKIENFILRYKQRIKE